MSCARIACVTVVLILSCVGAPPQPCTDCDGKCVDVMADSAHCGACNKACAAGSVCRAGQCVVGCGANLQACSGRCVDVQVDPANCGTCGTQCGAGLACVGGQCATVCAAGLTACAPTGADPYCARLDSDNLNCGACGVTCPAGRTCSGGSCVVACAAPMRVCGAGDAGVCTSTSFDVENCGACGTRCGPAQSCLLGACVSALPSSCDEYQTLFPQAADGEVTLYFRGDALKPYRATCTQMATPTPFTYVSVAGLDGGSTFSRFDNRLNGLAPCVNQPSPEVLTTWSRVRINPSLGSVVLNDFTFASSTGTNVTNTGSVAISRMDFGTAGDCACGRTGPACGPFGTTRYGTAQIDLRNTPFTVDPVTSWVFLGAGQSGTFSNPPGARLVNVTAGGCCGGSEPQHPLYGRTVQLKYAGRSCAAILSERPTAASGVYSMADGTGPGATDGPLMYCDMTREGGGWTLVAKVDGTSQASRFAFDSPLWTSGALLGPAVPDLSLTEAKYAPFGGMSFTQVRVISENGAAGQSIVLTFPLQDSLLAALSGGVGIATTTPRGPAAWTALADGGTLQANCNIEGLNMREPTGNGARVRIGVVANGENDCQSPDSFAGVGGALHPLNGVNICSQLPDGGPLPVPTAGAFGSVGCMGGTARGSFFATVWVR